MNQLNYINNNIMHIHQLGLPISFENIIPDDDSVRLLYDVTEGLNYTELYKTYSTNGRNPVILPETMFRIIIYGYMEGIYTSRSIAKEFMRLRKKSWEHITSLKGVILRMNRSIQFEGAFGVIKQDYGFRKFLMRGNAKVYTEFLLMAFGYNIKKLHNKTLQNRNGQLLHKNIC